MVIHPHCVCISLPQKYDTLCPYVTSATFGAWNDAAFNHDVMRTCQIKLPWRIKVSVMLRKKCFVQYKKPLFAATSQNSTTQSDVIIDLWDLRSIYIERREKFSLMFELLSLIYCACSLTFFAFARCVQDFKLLPRMVAYWLFLRATDGGTNCLLNQESDVSLTGRVIILGGPVIFCLFKTLPNITSHGITWFDVAQRLAASLFLEAQFPSLCHRLWIGSVLYKQSFADVCSSLILERRLAELTSYFGQTMSVTDSIERSSSWIGDRHVHKSSTRGVDSILVLWRLMLASQTGS